MIFDSNLIILAAKPTYPGLRRMLILNKLPTSPICKVESLGYHKLTTDEKNDLEIVFQGATLFRVTDVIIDQAIQLRQMRKMSLGDALIAATALVTGHELYTNNIKDFAGIPSLTVVDPIADGDPP